MTGANAYPAVFAPLAIGGVTLAHRIARAALTSASGRDGRVTPRMLALYREHARGGAALVVTESLAGHSAQQVGRRVRAMDEAIFDDLQRWAEAVEGEGSRLLGQLMDPGRSRHHAGRTGEGVGPSVLPDDLSWSVPRALSVAEIERMVTELAETAHRLQRAGFSGVELSCCHGHLFHQFLSPHANHRDDDYGGSVDNRTRIVRDLLDAIRSLCGDAFILGIKLVGDDGIPGGVDGHESARLAKEIAGHAPDYFSIAQGAHHRSLEMHVPDRTYPPTPYRHLSRIVRQAINGIPVFAVGRVTSAAEAQELIASGDCDGVMMGRALLADPALPKKTLQGRESEIRACIGCNSCWEQTVGGNPITCVVNPRVGTDGEVDWQPRPTNKRRRVVIVGTGPAGLEAARLAAARGHETTILGTAEAVGGKLRLNAQLPGCAIIASLHDYQLGEAYRAGVNFVLGGQVDIDAIADCTPDIVVLATGATMVEPGAWPAADAHGDVRHAVAALLGGPQKREDGTAILFDADHSPGTYDAAEYLADRFDRLVIVTPRECLAMDIASVIRQRVYRRLSAKRVVIQPLHEVIAASDGQAVLRQVYNGNEVRVDDVAMLTYASWRRPSDALLAPLRGRGIDVVPVGDAHVPRTLLHTMAEAHALGETI